MQRIVSAITALALALSFLASTAQPAAAVTGYDSAYFGESAFLIVVLVSLAGAAIGLALGLADGGARAQCATPTSHRFRRDRGVAGHFAGRQADRVRGARR